MGSMETVPTVAKLVAGTSRSEIHRRTGISLSGVSRIMSGNRVARSANLSKIAMALGVPMDDLYQHLTELRRKRLAAVRRRSARSTRSHVA